MVKGVKYLYLDISCENTHNSTGVPTESVKQYLNGRADVDQCYRITLDTFFRTMNDEILKIKTKYNLN